MPSDDVHVNHETVPVAVLKMDTALRRLAVVVIIVLTGVVAAVAVTLYVVIDCTQPGRKCYERGRSGGDELVRVILNDNREIHGAPTIPPSKEHKP